MLIFVIINTILSLGALLASFGLIMGAGYAQERRRGSILGSLVSIASVTLPVAALLSISGSWVSFLIGNNGVATAFIALPWVNLLLLLGGMALL